MEITVPKNVINLVLALIGGVVLLALVAMIATVATAGTAETASEAAQMEGDIQVITVYAQGGYAPNLVKANGGKQTQLKVITNSSYGCETAFTIPKLGISQNLPATGVTTFDLGIPQAGESIKLICSMGMYQSELRFS